MKISRQTYTKVTVAFTRAEMRKLVARSLIDAGRLWVTGPGGESRMHHASQPPKSRSTKRVYVPQVAGDSIRVYLDRQPPESGGVAFTMTSKQLEKLCKKALPEEFRDGRLRPGSGLHPPKSAFTAYADDGGEVQRAVITWDVVTSSFTTAPKGDN